MSTSNHRQEEVLFCQFIEDFFNRVCFKKNVNKEALLNESNRDDNDNDEKEKPLAEHDKMVVLLCLPQLMHGSFLSASLQVKLLRLVKGKVE